MKRGFIEKSTSKNAVGLIFVPKKDTNELRVCGNYIPLNRCLKQRTHAPPPTSAYRNKITSATMYSKYDIEEAYYHIKIHPSDRHLTTFRTPYGAYQYTVMPFGLSTAPAEWQLYLESVLWEYLGEYVTIHLDDILVFTKEDDAMHQRVASAVENALQASGLKLKESKCVRKSRTIEYCGHRYGYGKAKAVLSDRTMLDWPKPRNKSELRKFMGHVNFYRDYMPMLAHHATPLYDAMTKTGKWTWKQDLAFDNVKRLTTRMLDTSAFDPTKRCTIRSDASLFGIGAQLMQGGRTCAIISRRLTPPERNYTTTEREFLAVIYALEKWFPLLEGSPGIRVQTDHKNLAHELKESMTNRRMNRWILFVGRFRLHWTYLPGEENTADLLSRRPDYKSIKGGGRTQ
uniref:ORF1 n=1 Tax=Penicillium spinulosum metavirus 1 TaxID=1755795 RepID=A0A0S2KQB4_9VIRU|nr:ORF1 [Penicillium spinulosum metavirus 1]